MHFSFPQRESKITVATGVCTGGRNSPPDCSLYMDSNSFYKKKETDYPVGSSVSLVPQKEFESPTFRLGGGRSILLSYWGVYVTYCNGN